VLACPPMPKLLLPLLLLAHVLAVAGDAASDAEWLKGNAANEGVVSLPSGLQYKILDSGPADGAKPSKADSCTCHYTGTLVSGSTFDSSRTRGKPATFTPSGVIAGWTEALQLMRPGDRWMLYIPANLGYGSRGAGARIPPDSTLIFDLELIAVSQSVGLFAGTPLDMEVVGPIKLWHALAVLAVFVAYSMMGGGGGGKKVSASHILVKDEALCAELKAKIASGDKFAALAKAHSTCPSGKSGGSLGTFGPGQMVPAFDKVCWVAPIGEVQGPVQTQFGFHLIMVTERSDPSAGKAE